MVKLVRSFVHWLTTHEAKYSLMLVLFLLMFVLQPIFSHESYGGVIIGLVFSLIIISSIHVAGRKRSHFILSVVAGLITILSQWSGDLLSYDLLKMLSYFFGLSVLLLAMFSILWDIIKSSSVLYDTIAGAICVYLLMGVFAGVLFTLVDFLIPGSFSFPGSVGSDMNLLAGIENRMQALVYFSYSTLTTVGYGDITAVKPLARSLSVLLAICGQLYLTVVMAVLIGTFLKDRSRIQVRSIHQRNDR